MDEQRLHRAAFGIPDGVAYLNCAFMAPQHERVTEAGLAAVRRKEQPWALEPADFFDDVERLRVLFAAIVGGDADGVAVVPAVSYAMSTVAANVAPARGDRIIVLAGQYPSNVYPWRDLAARTGAEVVAVPRPACGAWTAAVVEAIDERAAVVAVPQTHFISGALLDLELIGAAARAAAAVFAVDATQSLGALPLDVARVGADVVVAAGYKWLLGPYSLGFAWYAPERRGWRPLEHHWAGRERSEDFARLADYTDRFRPGARRFDVGEVSNFTLVPMAVAALELVVGATPAAIAAAVGPLTAVIADAAASLGGEITEGPRAPHILSLRLAAGASPRVVDDLRCADVHVSLRGDIVRVSPHAYNTVDDVHRLLEVLARCA